MKGSILSIAIALLLLLCSIMAVKQGDITSEEVNLTGNLESDLLFPSDIHVGRVLSEYAVERIKLVDVRIKRFSVIEPEDHLYTIKYLEGVNKDKERPVYSNIKGFISQMYFVENDIVEKGELIFQALADEFQPQKAQRATNADGSDKKAGNAKKTARKN